MEFLFENIRYAAQILALCFVAGTPRGSRDLHHILPPMLLNLLRVSTSPQNSEPAPHACSRRCEGIGLMPAVRDSARRLLRSNTRSGRCARRQLELQSWWIV
jgi:hypothetical protein